jgi:BirA family transcriptional regulator, biotin operon repressor / biotin---[acetyl-CoA-carboxylase] ligase
MKHKNTIVLDETDSTNNYAMGLVASGNVADGTVVLSHFQQSGRGQQGNRWESARGKNLLASLIVFPGFLPPARQFSLSKVVSLALADWLRRETSGVSIKWPNDLYIGDKKVGGILIETTIQGNVLHSAVLGMGLNLNQKTYSPQLPNPVGLKQITGRNYDVSAVGQQVRQLFFSWYRKLKDAGPDETDAAYLKSLYRFNEWALYGKDGSAFEARIVDVGKYGQLILEDRSGSRSEYFFKEITFIL